MECYSAIKKNEIMPCEATWMKLEIIILSKTERERKISYNITYISKKKKDTNEFTYKAQLDSQI